jgi:hypothetical protein
MQSSCVSLKKNMSYRDESHYGSVFFLSYLDCLSMRLLKEKKFLTELKKSRLVSSTMTTC